MSDMEKDVNTGEDQTTEDPSNLGSSAEDLETHNPDLEDFDNVVKDIEDFIEDEEEETPGEAETTDDPSDEPTESGKEEEGEKSVPYDRFKEVNDNWRESQKESREKDTMIARLEGRLEALERSMADPKEREEATPAPLPLDEILSSETPQAILDALQEDPKGFAQGLEQRAAIRARQQILEEQEREAYHGKLRGGLDSFGEKYEDFIPNMSKFLQKVNENPHHNVISAYYEDVLIPKLEADVEAAKGDVDAQLKAAREEGFKAGKKEAIKEVRAKGSAASLDGSQSTHGSAAPTSELDDVKDGVELREKLVKDLVNKRAAS